MQKSITVKDIDDLPEAAQEILEFANETNSKVLLFYGSMGAGKTTLIRQICTELGVTDNVTSPTFALINEYSTEYGDAVYHFDFYRINSETEAFDLGYEEYFFSGDLCFVEWPEKIINLLPRSGDNIGVCTINIETISPNERYITLSSDC